MSEGALEVLLSAGVDPEEAEAFLASPEGEEFARSPDDFVVDTFDADFEKAQVCKFDESEHPRDDHGRFASEGGGGEREDLESYAGVKDTEWQTWAEMSAEVNEAVTGDLKAGTVDSNGQRVTEEDIAALRDIGERIQDAAESNAVQNTDVPGGVIFRGDSFESEAELRERFQSGKQWVAGGLTSAATDAEVALEYAEQGGPVKALLLFESGNGLHRGIQTAPLGVRSNEIVLPKGAAYRVASVTRGSDRIPGLSSDVFVVELYDARMTSKTKRLPVADAGRPR